jgi:hypothetical protein
LTSGSRILIFTAHVYKLPKKIVPICSHSGKWNSKY